MLIAIDHGNYAIKTPNFSFVAGYREDTDMPPIPEGVLVYNGKYFCLTGRRVNQQLDKTQNEDYFILTLFAVAKELEKVGKSGTSVSIDLAVGLPPEHYGAQREKFVRYLKRSGTICFTYNDKNYEIRIKSVVVFPQAFSAAVMEGDKVLSMSRVFIVDIGGFTTDVLMLNHGKPEMEYCRSLSRGVIHLYNDLKQRIFVRYNITVDDEMITDVLLGNTADIILPDGVIGMIRDETKRFTQDVIDKIKEFGMDLRVVRTIFIGGGSMMLKNILLEYPYLQKSLFIDNQNANAIGYYMLASEMLKKKEVQ